MPNCLCQYGRIRKANGKDGTDAPAGPTWEALAGHIQDVMRRSGTEQDMLHGERKTGFLGSWRAISAPIIPRHRLNQVVQGALVASLSWRLLITDIMGSREVVERGEVVLSREAAARFRSTGAPDMRKRSKTRKHSRGRNRLTG